MLNLPSRRRARAPWDRAHSTRRADQIVVDLNATTGNIDVTINGAAAGSFSPAQVPAGIRIDGNKGNDTITVGAAVLARALLLFMGRPDACTTIAGVAPVPDASEFARQRGLAVTGAVRTGPAPAARLRASPGREKNHECTKGTKTATKKSRAVTSSRLPS